MSIRNRKDITTLLNPGSIGCELGVFEGDFAQDLLSSNKFNKLYLIDIFSGYASNFGKYYPDASVLYNLVKTRFQDHSEIEVVKQDSVSFLSSTQIKFDFIYIDTVHTYEHLSQELNTAHRCIKTGGYICGHDYCSEFSGVVDAVMEFSEKYHYPLIITQEEIYPSFIISITQ